MEQGCWWERQQRKSGAETEQKKRMGEGMREEGADGVCRVVGVGGSNPSVARLWRVPNAWIARQWSSDLQDSLQRRKFKTSSKTFEFKRVATKINDNRVVFNLRSICLTFNYERKGSLKWTRSALITVPRSWGLWLHMHATLLALGWSYQSLPPLLQVNTMVLVLKTSCSGSTNRRLCI